MSDDDIRHEPAQRRFVLTVDGHRAVLAYRLAPGVITFTHTEVPAAIGGRGIAMRLARHGLDYARAEGLKVVPMCPVVAAYIKRHPEYEDLKAK